MSCGRQKFSLLITAFAVLAACGHDRKVEATKQSSDATTGDIPCEKGKDKCPPLQMAVSAAPLDQSGRLKGSIIGKQPFQLTGMAQGGGSRDIRMKAYTPPIGGSFVGQDTLSIKATYVASEALEGKEPIGVVLRDVSRCIHDRPGDDANCQNLDVPGYDAFEVKASVKWFIAEGDISQYADPSFTQAATVPKGANGGMTGCTSGFLPAFMQGALGGNLITGIIGGAISCVSGSMSGLQK